MEIEYYNIYMHYVLVTQNRLPIILEKFRERIEKKEHHTKESYEEEHKKLLNFYQKKSGNQVE